MAADDSTVHIYAPINVSEKVILNIAKDHIRSIETLAEKAKDDKNEILNKIINGNYYILYLGQKIGVNISKGATNPIYLSDRTFFINEIYLGYANKLINYWLEKRAREYLPKRVLELSKKTGLKFKKVAIKDVKSRWGSYSPRGTISLNWRLIKAPICVIDYVIIHELSHTVEMNHSKNFWKIVEKYKPNWRIYKKWLKINGHRLF